MSRTADSASKRHHQQQKSANKLAIIYSKIDTAVAGAEPNAIGSACPVEWPETATVSVDECTGDGEKSTERVLTAPARRQFVASDTRADYHNHTLIDCAIGAPEELRARSEFARASDQVGTDGGAAPAGAAAVAANQLRERSGLASEQVFSAPSEAFGERATRRQAAASESGHANSLISDNENRAAVDATGCATDESGGEQRATGTSDERQGPVAVAAERSRRQEPSRADDRASSCVKFAAFDAVGPTSVPFDRRAARQRSHRSRRLLHGRQQRWCARNRELQLADNESAQAEAQPATRQQQQQHVIIESNSTFWRRLSNLSRSITQRNCSNLPIASTSFACLHLSEPRAQEKSQFFACNDGTPSPGRLAALEERITDLNNQLAPEVVGYIARLREQLVCDNPSRLMQCAGSNSTQTVQQRAANMTVAAPAETAASGATATAAAAAAGGQQSSAVTGVCDNKQGQCNNENNINTSGSAINNDNRLIKIVELPATPTTTTSLLTHDYSEQQDQTHGQQFQLQRLDQGNQFDGGANQNGKSSHHHVKLSITTTNTTTTNTSNTTHSSASSLSSCILSESTTNSEVRLKWSKKMDFLLSIIGFAVDLANIWRFPHLVYENGGGVFLIPYIIVLIFGAIPVFFLELCLGQFVKKGPITVWNKIFPYMKGIGYCNILTSWYVSFYYNVIVAWSVYFIYRSISSFGSKMPWEDCDNSWNSQGGTCVSISQFKSVCSARNETPDTCRHNMYSNLSVSSPASEFFVKELSQIDQSSGLEDMGYLRPELVACLLIVYLLHYFSLFRGLETSGKVVWVTATAPYMILSILLIRGLFLPGAFMGIEYYLLPKLEKLADPKVWIEAAGQVFFSIGVGFGVHLTFASFNSHDNNCYRDCLITSVVNALTSVYSGLVVFVYLGYMATSLGVEIDEVAKGGGYAVAFEVYPEALTTLPFARFWSILFFIMLLTLGIDSAMGGLEAVITGLEDEFKFAKRLSRGQLTALVIISSFLPALINCTQGGAYTVAWFDHYSAGLSLLFSALFETIGVVYCYGLDKFILNIESMLGRRPHLFYILCWKYISPMLLFGIICMAILKPTKPMYRDYVYPEWSVVLGWFLALSSVAAIPIVALWTWFRRRSIGQALTTPSKSPRKSRATSGADSVTSGNTRKSPAHHHHQHQQGTECNQPTLAAAIITSSQVEHSHRHYMRTAPLYSHGVSSGSGAGEKNGEHML